MKPTLIIVTGLPATGKTTIARFLSERLQLPLFSKDDYKDLLFETLGTKDREWSKQIGRAAIEILYKDVATVLASGNCVIAESNFKPEFDNDRMSKLLTEHHAYAVQILCKANGDIVFERFAARAASSRHPGHDDLNSLEEQRPILLKGRAEPLSVPGLFTEMDTTDWTTVDLEDIAAIAKRHIWT
jgi:predicted kinase